MITTKEAAKIVGVGTETIRQYIRDGRGKDKEKLKAMLVKRGARDEYRIKLSDLEDFKKKYLTV